MGTVFFITYVIYSFFLATFLQFYFWQISKIRMYVCVCFCVHVSGKIYKGQRATSWSQLLFSSYGLQGSNIDLCNKYFTSWSHLSSTRSPIFLYESANYILCTILLTSHHVLIDL